VAPAAASEVKSAGSEALETDTAQTVEAEAPQTDTAQTASATEVQAETPIPAPAPPMTRADSAIGVYKSARNAIIAVNRKFPRPRRFQQGQSADTVKEQRAPDSALASADETIRSAWAAMGVEQPPRPEPPPEQPPQLPPPPPPASSPPDAAKTAAVLPPEPEAQAAKAGPFAKLFKGQAALGLLIPINPGPGEPNFKPWWNMGYHASYREIDSDALFSRGMSVDLSLYTFSEKEYVKYYESKGFKDRRENISISDASPLLIVDFGYHLKYYPVSQYKIPYLSGSAAISGAFGGGARASYNEYYIDTTNQYKRSSVIDVEENLIKDVYIFSISAGVGADYPVYAGLRAFAEIHYSLRLGLYSLFDEDGQYIGGFVPQIPIKFGVMMPFGSK